VNPSMGASRKSSLFCDDPEKPSPQPRLRFDVPRFVNNARCANLYG
jgi:hypothetical protein